MKRILLVLCTLILVATGAMSQTPQRGIGPGEGGWPSYTVKGEEFSVSLPFEPAMTTTKVLRKGDGKQRLERHLKTSLASVFYHIGIFENPEPRQSLEEFIAEQNANSEYDPATERSLTINGFAGKEYSSRSKTSPTVMQFLATEKRFFRFAAGGPGASGPLVEQFFSSITLGKETDGIEVSDGPGTRLESDTGERIFTGREVDQKARLLTKPEPSYTEKARREGIVGVVVLKVVFSATGEVNNIRVVSGLPHGLTEQAIKSARKIKFIPATKDGKPVSMWIQLEYNFNP